MKVFFSILSLSILAVVLSYSLGCFYAYAYPMSFKDEIESCADDFSVEGALIASIANVESNFNANALSNKGAVGIMQLMPSTAAWIAGKLDLEYDEKLLYEADYNIKLGSYYISYLINYFKDEKLGLCAYNAGLGMVKEWLKDERYSKNGKLLKIPYKETLNYYNKILKNYKYYKNKYK